MRQAPAFWWTEPPSALARLLQPIGAIYGAVAARRMARPGASLPAPVLCVGNFVAGGAGKTPTALALAASLQADGHRPAFLSRGYGRRVPRGDRQAVLRVDPALHDGATAGDEPLLLARVAPTYVSADRWGAGRRAVADGATVLILDDGLQNPALAKTLSVAVIDGAAGVGNELCVPAGPLRAPLSTQWPHVHAICVIGAGIPGERLAAHARSRGIPVLRAHLRPDPAVVAELADMPLLAFAGIGRPQKFFDTLTACGLVIAERRAFPDHHLFTASERAGLFDTATALGARLVTTAKDRARLPSDFPALEFPVQLDFSDPAGLARLLAPLHPSGPA